MFSAIFIIIMTLIFVTTGFTAWETWHKYEKEKLEVLESKCIQDAVRLSEVVIQQRKKIDEYQLELEEYERGFDDLIYPRAKKIVAQQREIAGLEDRIKDYEQAYVRRGVLLDLNGITEKGV